MARMLIVDGHAYAYRAFHAIRELRGPDGRPTNAIFGFIKMLSKMRANLAPSHVAVVWDGGLNAERMAALPGYKAQRPEMPADLGAQLDTLQEYLSAAGLASYCEDGVEADDYIAALAREAVRAGLAVVIASSDKDFMQLVGPGLGLLNPNDKTETIWGGEQVRAKSGVSPAQIVDWLSLMGDAVDNIPGVRGVGPKTAAELMNDFGSVEAIYRRLAEVKSARLREALAAAESDVRRNQALIRLKDALASPLDLDTFQPRAADNATLAAIFRRCGFRSMLAEVEAAGGQGLLLA
ncbi:MAG: hypothetical protein EPO07_08915 [Verrucomicrobia bacterium]|nr:MAG: hypothetical protein EPO07_08915 [Verrucomicrobiota bacterium]